MCNACTRVLSYCLVLYLYLCHCGWQAIRSSVFASRAIGLANVWFAGKQKDNFLLPENQKNRAAPRIKVTLSKNFM